MTLLFPKLGKNQQRGSKPRCHIITDGSAEVVADRLTKIADGHAKVTGENIWMPRGFVSVHEAQLDKSPLLSTFTSEKLAAWWLPELQQFNKTPFWDIVSTCTIDGRKGLLLVEAKSHEKELKSDQCKAGSESRASIDAALAEATNGLTQVTKLTWKLSSKNYYQLSNRFAWTWKLSELGIPVVLVYLGFLNANDMNKRDEVPFKDQDTWCRSVKSHSATLFPNEVWGRRWSVNKVPFIPIIRSLEVSLDQKEQS